MQIILPIIVFLLISFKLVKAESYYFEASPKNPVASSQNEVMLDLKYNLGCLSENRFRVRAVEVSSSNLLKINDSDYDKGSGWVNWPTLSKEVTVKMPPEYPGKTRIMLEIQDIKAGIVYKTPPVNVWGRKVFTSYVEKLNQNIMNWERAPEKKEVK